MQTMKQKVFYLMTKSAAKIIDQAPQSILRNIYSICQHFCQTRLLKYSSQAQKRLSIFDIHIFHISMFLSDLHFYSTCGLFWAFTCDMSVNSVVLRLTFLDVTYYLYDFVVSGRFLSTV